MQNKESTQAATKEQILESLRNCYDPEIPVNIVDLGLIYEVKNSEGMVEIKMTLTALGCPLSAYLENDIKGKVSQLSGVKEVKIEIVWDPPWSPEKMSKQARELLGM